MSREKTYKIEAHCNLRFVRTLFKISGRHHSILEPVEDITVKGATVTALTAGGALKKAQALYPGEMLSVWELPADKKPKK